MSGKQVMSEATNKRKLDSKRDSPAKRRLVTEEPDMMWQYLGYKSKSAFEKAESQAERLAKENDEEWQEVKAKEKKSEDKYKALSFEEKTKKLDDLLNKAGKFADFLRSQTEAQSAESKFVQPVEMTGGKEKLKLRSYQLKGAQWLNALVCNGMSGILADEMGLGKTIQVIAYVDF